MLDRYGSPGSVQVLCRRSRVVVAYSVPPLVYREPVVLPL